MYKNKKILAIIPARGNSKRLPNKNIKKLGDKPLIAWTIEAAKKSAFIDRVILSSDDSQIIKVSEQYGCEAPFLRPSHLATDNATSVDVLLHAIKTLDEDYDYMILLQPTSPFRLEEDIDASIKLCIDNQVPSVQSLTNIIDNPEWMFCVNENGTMQKAFSEAEPQKLEKYILNGAIYICDTRMFLMHKNLRLPSTMPYIMPRDRSIDIDTEEDFRYAEFLVSRRSLM